MDFETREVSFFVFLGMSHSLVGGKAQGATRSFSQDVRVFRSAPLHQQRSEVSALVAVFLARVCCLQEHIIAKG